MCKDWSGRGNAVLHTNFVGRRPNAPAVVGPLATPSGDIGETVNDKDNKKNNMLNLNHTHEKLAKRVRK